MSEQQKVRFVPVPKNTKAQLGEFVSLEGVLELEKRIDYSELGSIETVVGICKRKNGAANFGNVQHDLEHLNGCKVRVKIEVLEVPSRIQKKKESAT